MFASVSNSQCYALPAYGAKTVPNSMAAVKQRRVWLQAARLPCAFRLDGASRVGARYSLRRDSAAGQGQEEPLIVERHPLMSSD